MKKAIKFLIGEETARKIKARLIRIYHFFRRENLYIPNGYNTPVTMIDSKPKVTILLPIYNHVKVAKYSIKSILNQTYSNIELIILDDGSTDGLLEFLKPYHKLNNVKIYTQKNQKLPRALTHLHALADGEFITWTSADNIMHPQMIETLVKNLMAKPFASLVYADVRIIDKNNLPYFGISRDVNRDIKSPSLIRLNREQMPLSLGIDNYINACFLYRKEGSDILCGKYGDDIIGAEDYDFWLRLQKTGDLVHICNSKPLYFYRVHNNSMSHELETKKIKEHQSRLESLKKYEQERIEWCEKRPNVIFDSKFSTELKKKISESLSKLPVDIDHDNGNKKEILFSEKKIKNKLSFVVNDNYYTLYDGNKDIEVANIFKGIDVPRETYFSRNLYSHSYLVDSISQIKKPIFGTHVNSSSLSIEKVVNVIKNNENIVFAFLDEIENKNLLKLTDKYKNFIYCPKKIFGTEYQTYSNFARIISFDEKDITNNFKNLLLAYAIGRKISYTSSSDNFYEKFPFTVPFTEEIEFYEADAINDECYRVMNDYLECYSQTGALNKCVKYYNGYTQEMFIKRPAYMIKSIPEESSPTRVD